METVTVSKEFLLKAYEAACGEWKEKLENEFPEVFGPKYDDYKVYIWKARSGTYKLHRVKDNPKRYAWIDLSSSVCYANGTFSTAQAALMSVVEGDSLTIHDSIEEFYKS